ncbi:hypothetical protein [Sphingomonas colocasiae]|uniref:ImmA/IrrE family metallo-endopeptidase n=1 Tax=Sphingomonas colocasiae TaxID=1848973 RepID=A0ABS7PYE8_9SPHN|nr:hypothetical protein [Sphingomonas colocasiae]MBY8825675.1 hypothetical protein [Sphingomonas colocasiae]
MTIDDPIIAKILAFLDRIGIPSVAGPIEGETLLPGLTVRAGTLFFDAERLAWPGDLLHEAGHIAVTDPAVRAGLEDVEADPGQEMAAIAWSYAAALEIGIDPEIIFHEGGYRQVGGGGAVLRNFSNRNYIGAPMLQWYGMTAEPHQAENFGMPAYPVMTHWLRQATG